MGISPYPTPADGNILCLIVCLIAQSIFNLKDSLLSILHVVGIRIALWEEYSIESSLYLYECGGSLSKAYMEEFRIQTPPVCFKTLLCGTHRPQQACIVCLTEFEPDSEINHLPCGHIFHSVCLERWMKYWKVTCPLCRTRMVPQKEEEITAPM